MYALSTNVHLQILKWQTGNLATKRRALGLLGHSEHVITTILFVFVFPTLNFEFELQRLKF